MITDTHCHLASHKFPADEIPQLIDRAQEAGVHRMITLATSLEDFPSNLQLAEQYDSIYCCLGIHPCDVHETPDSYLAELKVHAQHAKCVAIGETGLDYFHPAPDGWTEADYHQRQRDFLTSHFELAAELGLNIVIHTRDKSGDQSFRDALAIYRLYAHKVRAVFHCFLGPWQRGEAVVELGGVLSYTGIATFKKSTDVLDAAVQTPAGAIMVETDAPYLAPVPHRGKRNEPSYTQHTAEHIAKARGESLESFAEHSEKCAKEFFKLA
ncbi:TatD family hydrolase [Persicirhabdus sediminis]|uniref:TatD family hydrolase n=1 Tax=Persicirhabdus sediminis TaxID=454144 RepID=A0A8J7MEI0_9BACT|nr:TatD family hydrolase [Persicirhabdus sediminis]MBK1791826.1 TatD family hydrolase [Persicirhabdus sediminis]